MQVVPGDLSAGHRAAVEAEHPALQPPPLYSLDPDRGEAGRGRRPLHRARVQERAWDCHGAVLRLTSTWSTGWGICNIYNIYNIYNIQVRTMSRAQLVERSVAILDTADNTAEVTSIAARWLTLCLDKY